MSELRLRRVLEHNQRLREDLARPRVRVSEASAKWVSLASCEHFQMLIPAGQFDSALQNN
jgi:hypothetical protein